MKQKMYLSFGALLLGAMTVQAQSSIVAGGCNASSSQGAVMGITVGQLAVETFSKSSGSVLLGIQQDYSVVESAVATNPIPDIEVPKDGEAGNVNLGDYFITDSKLDYSVTSTDDAVVKPVLDGMNLTFVLGKPGTVTITVVAINEKGEKTTLSFSITVEGDEEPPVVYDNPKERLVALYGKATTLLNSTTVGTNPGNYLLTEYIALYDLNQKAQAMLTSSAGDDEITALCDKLEKAMNDYTDSQIPTAIDEIANEPMISVVGYTVYISNMNGEPCAVYGISGKCVYSCKDMQNAMVTMRTVGTYIVKIGNKQQNVVLK